MYLILQKEKVQMINMKDKHFQSVLLDENQIKVRGVDRLVPLNNFSYEEWPYLFLNDRDIMDIKSAEIADEAVQLRNCHHICLLSSIDRVLSYESDNLCLVSMS